MTPSGVQVCAPHPFRSLRSARLTPVHRGNCSTRSPGHAIYIVCFPKLVEYRKYRVLYYRPLGMIQEIRSHGLIDASLIDEFGELSRQRDLMKPVEKRLKELAETFQACLADHPPEAPISITGKLYVLQVGPRSEETKIVSMRKVYKALGVIRFLKLCSITLKAVKENLPALYESLVVTEATGPRRIKAVAKAASAVSQEAA